MIDLKQLQSRIYDNKVAKGFNVTDIYMEFCYTYGELNEACEAYMNKKDKNIPLLLRYAKSFNVEKIIRGYLEVLL